MNNLKTLFGRKIKEYRKKKNLTQAQLAELVNVDVVALKVVKTSHLRI